MLSGSHFKKCTRETTHQAINMTEMGESKSKTVKVHQGRACGEAESIFTSRTLSIRGSKEGVWLLFSIAVIYFKYCYKAFHKKNIFKPSERNSAVRFQTVTSYCKTIIPNLMCTVNFGGVVGYNYSLGPLILTLYIQQSKGSIPAQRTRQRATPTVNV